MKQLHGSARQKQAGFTLVELLVVIFMVGVLLAVAAPTFLHQADNAKDLQAKQLLSIVQRELHAAYIFGPFNDTTVTDVRTSEPSLYIINNTTYNPDIVSVEMVSSTQAILRTSSATGNNFCLIETEGTNVGVKRNWDGSATSDCSTPVAPPSDPIPPTPPAPTPPPNIFNSFAVISLNPLKLSDDSKITGPVASNNAIQPQNRSQICGDAHPGPGFTVTPTGHQCAGYSSTPGTSTYSPTPVDASAAAASNLNSRICNQDVCTGSVTYNTTTKILTMSNDGHLTLSGSGSYYFCSLVLNNQSVLTVAAGATPTIYIGSPDVCGNTNGDLTIGNNALLVNNNAQAKTLAFCMAGSATRSTTILISNSVQASSVTAIYAPRTDATIQNNATLVGALYAKTINFKNWGQLIYDSSAENVSC